MDLVKAAVSERPFQQLSLMSKTEFDSFLTDRGVRLPYQGVQPFVASSVIEALDDSPQCFHPFQVWPVSKLLLGLEIASEVTNGNDVMDDFASSKFCRQFNQTVLPLMLWIESRFLPIVRGPRPNVVLFSDFDSPAWYHWTQSLNLAELLDRHSMTIDDVSNWRQEILSDAYSCDPSPELYLLIRSIPFDVRERRLRGSLRLAYDLYEMAEIIRLFLEQISDLQISKEWDPWGSSDTSWVERLYGSQPSFGDPKFLRPLIRDYGLDPSYRVTWLVEGPTEEGFILRYSKVVGVNIQTYTDIRSFGGDGAFTKQLAAIDADLESAREEQRFVTLTFDDSNGARTRLKGLVKSGLVNFPYVMNGPDFELDNFTVEQLVAVAVAWMSDLQRPISLCQATLAQQVQRRIDDKKENNFKDAFDSVLFLNDVQFKLSKGKEWGERLATYLISARASQTEREGGSPQVKSKIERQIDYVIRNSEPFIDYPGSIERLDPAQLEIQ